MIKKIFLIVVLLAGLLFLVSDNAFAAAAASAGDKIGVIDSQMVITKHPRFEDAMKELQTISKKKEEEARNAADLETDDNRKAQKIREKRLELAKEEQRIMEPIIQEAQLAVRTIAKNKGLTIILEKASVYVGGIDITEDVVQQIKKQALSSSATKK
ncbi:MAG: OmpH family outer membrane protein [Synergistaceae bacterium]|nr:OmpH family outer membrane protein [Synergistaceae bacterium]